MNTIKFSADYEKLPENWEGTKAMLISVVPTPVRIIKEEMTAFWKYDTKYRGREEFYHLNFKEALILVFIHLNSGLPFTTIRRNYQQKLEYYTESIGDTFLLERTEK